MIATVLVFNCALYWWRKTLRRTGTVPDPFWGCGSVSIPWYFENRQTLNPPHSSIRAVNSLPAMIIGQRRKEATSVQPLVVRVKMTCQNARMASCRARGQTSFQAMYGAKVAVAVAVAGWLGSGYSVQVALSSDRGSLKAI